MEKGIVLALIAVGALGLAVFFLTGTDRVEAPDYISPTSPQDEEEAENGDETEIPPKASGKCYVGGCSGQLCSDIEGLASTCEWREEYACYRTATCKRQANGECGCTITPELQSCLNNYRSPE
ncbi:MAG: hypothetical protein HYS89_02315 [Candidatus Colwellbacteria bacterium]|nr:hypothetical protein [Candidatus Colwellbacteria bacterium]